MPDHKAVSEHCLHEPLIDPEPGNVRRRRLLLFASNIIWIGLIAAFCFQYHRSDSSGERDFSPAQIVKEPSRVMSDGVSGKKVWMRSGSVPYPWSNDMLAWQRTAFHFQPKMNWMNDPNGPMFYQGWYHLFYQYNPGGAVWGNIVWGHAVSRDLIQWRHLPLAMVADQWYDSNGVWTGSATILPNGRVIMLYTGSTNESVQVQNLAFPADSSDPLLVDWVKYSGNPVLVPPPGIDIKDFRDPTTAWYTPDKKWRILIGSKINKTGISLVYDTHDFIKYQLVDEILHGVPGTGMWECVDFYPISESEQNGLDTSSGGPDVKYVLKSSLDDEKKDYYSIGKYHHDNATWLPDDPSIDVGFGLRYDYGDFYASKTFFDQKKRRRILWGWIRETDSERADVMKGWASVQSIPRTVLFDKETGSGLIQWPVDELETLRSEEKVFQKVIMGSGSLTPLDVSGASATQLDIMAEFEIDGGVLGGAPAEDSVYDCRNGGGAAGRGSLGPFGLLVLADDELVEQTPLYFYLSKRADGSVRSFFCADESRSSRATDVDGEIHGSVVPVLGGEKLSMRVLVDHSIVEGFAQGGRACITARVYPTVVYGGTRIFLFNNSTRTGVTASVRIWRMHGAAIQVSAYRMQMALLLPLAALVVAGGFATIIAASRHGKENSFPEET